MHWPEIGAAYRGIFSRIAAEAGLEDVKPRRGGVAVLAESAVVAGA
jgi:hypothetical protein